MIHASRRASDAVYDPTWFVPTDAPLVRAMSRASLRSLDLPRIVVTDELGVASDPMGTSSVWDVDADGLDAEAQGLLMPTQYRPVRSNPGSRFFEHLTEVSEQYEEPSLPEPTQVPERLCVVRRWWHAITHIVRAVLSLGHQAR